MHALHAYSTTRMNPMSVVSFSSNSTFVAKGYRDCVFARVLQRLARPAFSNVSILEDFVDVVGMEDFLHIWEGQDFGTGMTWLGVRGF